MNRIKSSWNFYGLLGVPNKELLKSQELKINFFYPVWCVFLYFIYIFNPQRPYFSGPEFRGPNFQRLRMQEPKMDTKTDQCRPLATCWELKVISTIVSHLQVIKTRHSSCSGGWSYILPWVCIPVQKHVLQRINTALVHFSGCLDS